jgi:hypothetical protein
MISQDAPDASACPPNQTSTAPLPCATKPPASKGLFAATNNQNYIQAQQSEKSIESFQIANEIGKMKVTIALFAIVIILLIGIAIWHRRLRSKIEKRDDG